MPGIVVFAHTPPPHHGQSVMVELLLKGLEAGRAGVYHVNARVSEGMQDVGGMRAGKLAKLLSCCIQALWLRLRHEADVLYYVPAPAKRSAVLRDMLALALLRPFFGKTVFHWHAYGLGHWVAGKPEHPAGPREEALVPPVLFGVLEAPARWWAGYWLRRADLSIVLTPYNRNDSDLLDPVRTVVIPNGISDPCPDFESAVLPGRLRHQEARKCLLMGPAAGNGEGRTLPFFQIAFLAHCTREKGLFDALETLALLNMRLVEIKSSMRASLVVAGQFVSERERNEFNSRIGKPDLQGPEGLPLVTFVGFVEKQEKDRLFRESDALLFPTRFHGETFGLVIAEAHLYGMPAVVSRWRGLPELALSSGGSSPAEWAEQLWQEMRHPSDPLFLRRHGLEAFTKAAFADRMREALDFRKT